MLPLLLLMLLTLGGPVLLAEADLPSPTTTTRLTSTRQLALVAVAALPSVLAAGPRFQQPKWKKQACEAPASQHPNSHYVCDEAGEVKCLPGWTGDLCDVPICRKGCDPLQGYCRRPGQCRCKLGFYGETCDKCVALPGCQHGRCNVSFECACDPGWRGMFCSEPICHAECNPNQGYCDKPGECRCRLGWQGPMCKQCSVLPGCVHGTCKGPLECRCEPGWTGFLCSTPICSAGCSREHGGCRRPNTCRCRVGYTGPNCTECVPYPGCQNGSCRNPWECRCNPGWAGELCDQRLTYCDEHADLCQNNATCVSLLPEMGDYRCVCPLGYAGRHCEREVEVPATELMPPAMPANETSLAEPEQPEAAVTTPRTGPSSSSTADPTEPLGHLVVTEQPHSVDKEQPQTAGKWPTEPPTHSPLDAENET